MIDNYSHADSQVFYITENIMGPYEQSAEYEQLLNDYNSQLNEHCRCDGICSQATCRCIHKSGGENYLAYQKGEQIKYQLIHKSKSYPTLECNETCLCSDNCGNRVAQKGPAESLEIRNCEKGFGLFTTCFIPSGTFICEYAGELITTSQATKRYQSNKVLGKSNYIFCLRELSSNTQPIVTIIDPTIFGNIGRYLNHSCQPNCIVTPVRCGSPIPKVAIFAGSDIQQDEELTFHYGANDEVNLQITDDRTRCLCKSNSCTGFMPFHGY